MITSLLEVLRVFRYSDRLFSFSTPSIFDSYCEFTYRLVWLKRFISYLSRMVWSAFLRSIVVGVRGFGP